MNEPVQSDTQSWETAHGLEGRCTRRKTALVVSPAALAVLYTVLNNANTETELLLGKQKTNFMRRSNIPRDTK